MNPELVKFLVLAQRAVPTFDDASVAGVWVGYIDGSGIYHLRPDPDLTRYANMPYSNARVVQRAQALVDGGSALVLWTFDSQGAWACEHRPRTRPRCYLMPLDNPFAAEKARRFQRRFASPPVLPGLPPLPNVALDDQDPHRIRRLPPVVPLSSMPRTKSVRLPYYLRWPLADW